MALTLSYEEVLKALYSKRRFESCNDLNAIHTCLKHLGHPDKAYSTIHIAGTNGKGQVSTAIAAVLEKSGYKVGLFTSPHLFNFEERIVINGIPIAKEKVVSLYSLLETLPFNLIFFELVTLMGLTYFRDVGVDVAVIEAGIGGELDTTNVITPILSVITSISLEHTEHLGNTLDAIAAHKAGIIKPHIPVVLGVKAKQRVLFEKAKQVGAPVYSVEGEDPFYQSENRKCAEEAVKVLSSQFVLRPEAVASGLMAIPRCRFERRGEWIFDVAHNPDGFLRLAQALEWHYPNQTFRFVVGMGKCKQIKECLAHIEPKIAHIHFVCDGRAESATTGELAALFQEVSKRPFSKELSIKEAVQSAYARRTNEKIVVCGSFYIMNEAS